MLNAALGRSICIFICFWGQSSEPFDAIYIFFVQHVHLLASTRASSIRGKGEKYGKSETIQVLVCVCVWLYVLFQEGPLEAGDDGSNFQEGYTVGMRIFAMVKV